MTMTLLQVAQEFADRMGLERPSFVMASTEDMERQIRALANEVINDITSRGESWPMLQKQATFTSVASTDQGLMSTIAPYGFKYVIVESLYDRTDGRPLFGPRNAPRWQESEAVANTGPLYTYRIWQGRFMVQPALPAGHTIAFEYASDMAILRDDGTTWVRRFVADTDVFQLDEELLLSGLKWKWRRAKGLSYAEEQRTFEILMAQAIGNGPQKGALNLRGMAGDIRPGIWVPSGNWPI